MEVVGGQSGVKVTQFMIARNQRGRNQGQGVSPQGVPAVICFPQPAPTP